MSKNSAILYNASSTKHTRLQKEAFSPINCMLPISGFSDRQEGNIMSKTN